VNWKTIRKSVGIRRFKSQEAAMDARRRSRAVMAIQWVMSAGLAAAAVTFPGVAVHTQEVQAPSAAAPAAAPAPRPRLAPELTPVHSVDLMTADGAAVFRGQWRNMDARIVEAPPRPNAAPWKVSYDLQPKAGAAGFDDSSWPTIEAKALADRRGGGGVFMTWYRIALTIPQKIADLDTTGAMAVFHIIVDDYAEVWVNGQLPRAVGMQSGNMVVGFNLPNRVIISDAVKPGERVEVAVLGINGPISLAPLNPVFVREARVEFFK
jgi:gluconolactonase